MNEALFTPERPDCDVSHYSAPDVMASEVEVSRFVGALVDLLHPNRVLETGTYLGHTAGAIGFALRSQHFGHLDTIEQDATLAETARRKLTHLPVTVHRCHSLDFIPEYTYDLFFLDSDIEDRVKELSHFRRFASRRAVVALHDSRNATLQRALRDFAYVDFPTPRGLALLRWP